MLRIRLVGELRLELDGQPLPPIASGRARSLLAWLAYHEGLHPRSKVAAVFWPDVLESSARGSLRTTLATVRRALPAAAADVLDAGRERIGIADGPAVSVDVREAARLAAAGDLEAALALADGELVADLDDEWALVARDAHRERVIALLGAAGERAEADGRMPAALRHARRRLELDPVSEDAARELMARLARAGDGAAAAKVFEALRAALRRGLGMAPSAQTVRLAAELRGAASPAAAERPLPDALARPEHAPLTGREEQLVALREAWERARAGAAGVVTLEGAAGSGKTRLLSAFGAELRQAGATVLAGRCREDGLVAYAPFTEALRQHLEDAPDALPDWVAGELARLLPELAPDAARPAGRPEDARHRLLEAVAATIGQAARRGPVLLVVEDLHWADRATLQMLAHVVWTVGWAPLLDRGLDPGGGRGARARRSSSPSSPVRAASRACRSAASPRPRRRSSRAPGSARGRRPRRSPRVLHARTGGNPLFVEELVRQLLETHPGETGAALVAAARTGVPVGVRAVIDQRLARLPELAVRAVRMAAVAGEDFTLADVAAACETSDERLAEELDAAVAAGLVDEGVAPGRFRFAHALVREAVLAGEGGTRRALAHRRMAAVLEPDERRVPEVARHLLDARPLVAPAEAARWALRAARRATRGLAYEDAAAVLERAADAELEEHPALRGEVCLALGDARSRAGDGPAARRSFAAATAIARTGGDAELLARAALGAAGLTVSIGPVRDDVRALLEEALAAVADDSALRPALLARLVIELYYAPPTTLREELSAEALAAGRRAGGRALLETLNARHVALWSPAHTEDRLAIADELIATAIADGDREAELQGLNWRVADLFELGEMDALRATVADHERLAGELRLPAYAWYAPMWHAALALLADRLDEAERHSETGRRIGLAAQDDNAALLFGTQRFALFARHRAARSRGRRADPAPRGAFPRARRLAGRARRSGATRSATTTPRRAGSRRRSPSSTRSRSTRTGSTRSTGSA